ncbi:MAG TPA: hypothetical protein PKM43_06510 [Verrucomicrobiota bacterium]|nr:hypothetical protein [Verrucomicrobiota bacterium]HRZ56935.1 hypothetical protein [Candidatus Paceibacterota bacterium]
MNPLPLCLCAVALWAAAALPALAQPRLEAQFRLDGGTAQALPLVSSDTSRTQYWQGSFALDVSAANLSVGPHYLEVRMADTNGVWCAWQGQWFRVSGPASLTAAELFVDADPGPGNGTPIPLPADGAWGGSAEDYVIPNVATTNLSTGRHTLFVRCKDSNGDWGLTNATVFYVANELAIVAAEWTDNPYAAAGTGHPMQIKQVPNSPVGEVTLQATDTTLSVGTNYCAQYPLYARVQDNLGRWSTREGWYLDAARTNWLFDAATAWADAQQTLVVAPELPSAPVLGNYALTNNGALSLSWKACQGVTGYEVWGRTAITQPFTRWATGPDNSFMPAAAFTAGTHDWWVRSLGGTDCFRDGPLWHFTVAAPRADDTDNDGLADAWEREQFGQLFRADGVTDYDADGFLDWQEWAAGTDPKNALDVLLMAGCRKVPEGVAADFPTAAGHDYTVYFALELDDRDTVWNLFDEMVGTGELMSVTNTWPDPQGYFFISVMPP